MSDVNKYFDLGFKMFPAHIFLKKKVDGGFEKIFIFGPRDTEFSGWRRCQHTIDTFKARWKALEGYGKPPNSICMECGSVSSCTVVDRDDNPESNKILNKYAPGIYDGPHDKSPNNGNHFYFRYSPGARTMSNTNIGIDVRNDGGLVVMPPSFNAKGKYEWVHPILTLEDLPDFPPLLFGLLFGSGARRKEVVQQSRERPSLSEIENMLAIMSGNRYGYDDWLRITSSLWSTYTFEETINLLKRYLPEEKPGEYQYKYEKRIVDGLTLGTFIHFYKEARKVWSPCGTTRIVPLRGPVSVPEPVPLRGPVSVPEPVPEPVEWEMPLDYCVDFNIGDEFTMLDGVETYLGNGRFSFRKVD